MRIIPIGLYALALGAGPALAGDPPAGDGVPAAAGRGGVRADYDSAFVPSHSGPHPALITADEMSREFQSVERDLYPCPEPDICRLAPRRPVSEIICRAAREARSMRCDFRVFFDEYGGRISACSLPLRLRGQRWRMDRIDLNLACRVVRVGS